MILFSLFCCRLIRFILLDTSFLNSPEILYFTIGGSDGKASACNATRVWFLGREDPLEKEMAIHSSILAWTIPWTEEPGGLQSMMSQRDTTERLNSHPFCSDSKCSLTQTDFPWLTFSRVFDWICSSVLRSQAWNRFLNRSFFALHP